METPRGPVWLAEDEPFPDPATAPSEGLVALGGNSPHSGIGAEVTALITEIKGQLDRYEIDRVRDAMALVDADAAAQEFARARNRLRNLLRAKPPLGADHQVALKARMVQVATAAEQAFDRAWMNDVLQLAVGRLRRRLKEAQFRAFERYDLAGVKATYAEVASELGIKETDVRNHLFTARELLRDEVRAELSETIENPGELQEELKAFFDA